MPPFLLCRCLALLCFVMMLKVVHAANVTANPACATCNCFKRAGRHIVDCSFLDLEEIPQGLPKKTYELILTGNLLRDIGYSSVLSSFTLLYLRRLYINNNVLTNISDSAFNVVPNLKILTLNWNSLTEINDKHFTNLTSLKILWLNNNQITNISSKAFESNSQLQELDLNSNLLAYLHNGMFSTNTKIVNFDARYNNLNSADCCNMCGISSSAMVKWHMMDNTEISCGCGDGTSCTDSDGETLSCFTDTCSTYTFNSAHRRRGFYGSCAFSLTALASLASAYLTYIL